MAFFRNVDFSVLLSNNAIGWSPLSVIGQFFFLAFLFLIIISASYFVSKRVGVSRFNSTGTNNLQVMEGVYIGAGQSILLVRTGDRYFTVGVTKDRISFLADASCDSLNFDNSKQSEFKSLFDDKVKSAFNKLRDNKKR